MDSLWALGEFLAGAGVEVCMYSYTQGAAESEGRGTGRLSMFFVFLTVIGVVGWKDPLKARLSRMVGKLRLLSGVWRTESLMEKLQMLLKGEMFTVSVSSTCALNAIDVLPEYLYPKLDSNHHPRSLAAKLTQKS